MNPPLADEDRPEIATPSFRFQWEEAQQAHVLLYPEGMVRLNPSAGAILQLCDGDRTVTEIIGALNAQFPDVDLAHDVRQFLETATDNGWIRSR